MLARIFHPRARTIAQRHFSRVSIVSPETARKTPLVVELVTEEQANDLKQVRSFFVFLITRKDIVNSPS